LWGCSWPVGTGKTIVVCSACREHPDGVIYVEITEPQGLPEKLATQMGMQLGPSNLEDVVFGYKHYYELPPGQLLALDLVLETFKSAAERYQAKMGNIPSVFIGRIDLLAKADSEAFL